MSKYDDESICVYNRDEPNRLEDTLSFKASKWDPGKSTKPSFVLVNENLGLLYVQADGTASAGGGGAFTLLLAVDLNAKNNRSCGSAVNWHTTWNCVQSQQ